MKHEKLYLLKVLHKVSIAELLEIPEVYDILKTKYQKEIMEQKGSCEKITWCNPWPKKQS